MSNKKIKEITIIAVFTAIIVICSQITIPSPIPFTLQTFAVFLCLGILGGKKGIFSILLYVILGIIGLPVFSSFSGGFGVILNATGGYILGFIFSALIYLIITSVFKNFPHIMLTAMFAALLGCYIFGTFWYYFLFLNTENPISFFSALATCVFPFVLPDFLKILLAYNVSKKIKILFKI